MRENCTSGSEGGGAETNRLSLPLSKLGSNSPHSTRQAGAWRSRAWHYQAYSDTDLLLSAINALNSSSAGRISKVVTRTTRMLRHQLNGVF